MSQSKFKRRFEVKYRGADMTCIRAQEFITLTRDIYTVKEYLTKFNHLIRYALEVASTERGPIEKFFYKLDLTIARDNITRAQPPQTYDKALSRALRVEVFVKRIYGQSSTQIVPLLSLIPTLVPLQQASSSSALIQRGPPLEIKRKRPFQAKGNKKGRKSGKK